MDDVRMFVIDSIFSYKRQKWNNNNANCNASQILEITVTIDKITIYLVILRRSILTPFT